VHSPPCAPNHPGLQVHATDELLFLGDSELVGQISTEFPPVQNKLALHSVHVAPFSPTYPAWHVQFWMKLLPALEWELVGQGNESSLLQYMFSGHSEQTPVACSETTGATQQNKRHKAGSILRFGMESCLRRWFPDIFIRVGLCMVQGLDVY
jgi:hypothetical protein